jgi:hypothetical protein
MPSHNSPSLSRQRLAIENDEYSDEDDSGDDRHSVDREDWSDNHQVVVSNQKVLYLITGQHLKLAEIGIKRELEKLALTLGTRNVDSFAGRPLEANSRDAYEKHFKGLKYFFSRFGDYQSMLMLSDKPPPIFAHLSA